MTTYQVLGRSGPLGRGLTLEAAHSLASVSGGYVCPDTPELGERTPRGLPSIGPSAPELAARQAARRRECDEVGP